MHRVHWFKYNTSLGVKKTTAWDITGKTMHVMSANSKTVVQVCYRNPWADGMGCWTGAGGYLPN
jgi:hypothetical protein